MFWKSFSKVQETDWLNSFKIGIKSLHPYSVTTVFTNMAIIWLDLLTKLCRIILVKQHLSYPWYKESQSGNIRQACIINGNIKVNSFAGCCSVSPCSRALINPGLLILRLLQFPPNQAASSLCTYHLQLIHQHWENHLTDHIAKTTPKETVRKVSITYLLIGIVPLEYKTNFLWKYSFNKNWFSKHAYFEVSMCLVAWKNVHNKLFCEEKHIK